VLVAIVLVPLGVGVIAQGRWPFALFIAFILGVAAWEYWHLFSAGGYRPSVFLLVGGALALAISRHLWGFEPAGLLLTLAVMGAFAVQCELPRAKKPPRWISISIWAACSTWAGWVLT
jgi:phosphatidate cytidylyltransferase